MKNRMNGCVSALALIVGAAMPAMAEQTVIYSSTGVPLTAGTERAGVQVQLDQTQADAVTRAQEIEAADDARTIDQEPIGTIVSPAYRYVETEPGVGGPGDVFNVTNVENYESTVAGSVYSPVLSTENVNKLYVDNSLNYLTEQFNTEITNIKQDIQNVTVVLSGICQDMEVVKAKLGTVYVNGAEYEWLSALGNQCGNIDWNFDKTVLELIKNYGFNHGCADRRAALEVTYRYNGEDVGHSTWAFAHDNPHSRSVMYQPSGWTDADNDGRDDDSWAAYVEGYDAGYGSCDAVEEAPTVTYVNTETPILLTRNNYNAYKSYKRSGDYYRGSDSRPNRDWQVGDYAYYSGVATTEDGISIDAKITMLANDDRAYVSMSVDSYKNNVLNIWGDSYTDSAEVDFKIEFLNGRTGNPISLRSTLTTADLDGTDVGSYYGYSEDVIYNASDISSYSVVPGSEVLVREQNGRIYASGNGLNDSGAAGETTDQDHWFSAVFEGSSVRFSLSPRTSPSGFGFNGQVMQQNAIITYPDGTVVRQ